MLITKRNHYRAGLICQKFSTRIFAGDFVSTSAKIKSLVLVTSDEKKVVGHMSLNFKICVRGRVENKRLCSIWR